MGTNGTRSNEAQIGAFLGELAWARRLAQSMSSQGLGGDDAVQDAWVAILEGRAAGVRAPRAWFQRVARNFARIARRRAQSQRSTEAAAASPKSSDDLIQSDDPAERLARAELLRKVVDAVLAMPEPYRATLLAHYLDELSAEEIARRQGVSGSTVRNRLRRGLQRLRRNFEPDRHHFAWLPWFRFPEIIAMSKGAKLAWCSLALLTLGAAYWWRSGPLQVPETVASAGQSDPPALASNPPGPVEAAPAEPPSTRTLVAAQSQPPESVLEPPIEQAAATKAAELWSRELLVVDHEGEPVSEVRLRLESDAGAQQEPLRTDALGRCTLYHATGEVRVDAFRADVGLARANVPFSEQLQGEPFELRLTRPLVVNGLVLDAYERPVQGATVSARLVGAIVSEERPFAPADVTTDSEGRFTFQLHSLGSFYLSAKRGTEASYDEAVSLSLGYEVDVTLRFLGAIAIDGRLRLPDGSPAAEAWILVREPELIPGAIIVSSDRRFHEWTRSDDRGRFSIDLPRYGTYELTIRSKTTGPLFESITVDEVQPRRTLDLWLPEPAVTHGRVLWEDGRPVAGCRLMAWPPESTLRRKTSMASEDAFRYGHVTVTTEADGTFALQPLRKDAAYTVALHPDPTNLQQEVRFEGIRAGDRDVELVLKEEELRGAFVYGSVSAQAGRLPRPVRWHMIWRETKSEEPWFTDTTLMWNSDIPRRTRGGEELWRDLRIEGGTYRIEHLIPDRQYVLFATAAGQGVELIGPFTASLAGTRRDIRLRPPRSLTIEVVDSLGLPASNARVSLSYTGTVKTPLVLGQRFADEHGTLHYEALYPGIYAARARLGDESARKEVELTVSSTTTRLVLELE